jgi:hypothetical protein
MLAKAFVQAFGAEIVIGVMLGVAVILVQYLRGN